MYWLGSNIKITCSLSSINIKVEECSWFINDKRVTNGQIYQVSVNENSRECTIVVVSRPNLLILVVILSGMGKEVSIMVGNIAN